MKLIKTIPHSPLLPSINSEYVAMLIRDIAQLLKESLSENGIKQDSIRSILISLSQKDGVTQLDLAKDTHLKPPTVSVALTRLEEMKYVRRTKDRSDMRVVRAFLTEKGKNLCADSVGRIKETEVTLMKGMSDDERRTLVMLLAKMQDNMLKAQNHKDDEL